MLSANLQVLLVTTNQNKLIEYRKISKELGANIFFHKWNIDLGESSNVSIEEDAKRKAFGAFKKLNRCVMVESSGLAIKEMNGFPGALTKQVYNSFTSSNPISFSLSFGNKEASAVTCIAVYDGLEMKTFNESVLGMISSSPSGNKGFGWDNLFCPEGSKHTFGEMSIEEKNQYSMRKKALIQFTVDTLFCK